MYEESMIGKSTDTINIENDFFFFFAYLCK